MLKIYHWWKALLVYTWFIVVWGAFVRASGSGDGCGKNWPTCHGELIPNNSSIQTLIEFIHRATSGIYGIFVLILVVVTILHIKKTKSSSASSFLKSKATLAYILVSLTLILTVFEALIGAKLVLSGLVGSNTSWSRALIMIVHLLNTFLLVASIVGVLFLLSPNQKVKMPDLSKKLYLICTLSLILVAGLGALTALGDTLYPAESLHHGVTQDFAMGSPWILRLRVFHPIFAVLSVYLITLMVQNFWKDRPIFIYLFLAYFTLAVGLINLLLLAPIYMQLIHLLTAQMLWSKHSKLGFKLLVH